MKASLAVALRRMSWRRGVGGDDVLRDLELAAGVELELDEVGGDEGVADREVDRLAAGGRGLAGEGEARPAAQVGEAGRGAGDVVAGEQGVQRGGGVEDEWPRRVGVGGGVRGAGDGEGSALAVEQDLHVGVEELDLADARTQGDDDAAAAEVVGEEVAGAGHDGARDAVGVAVTLEVQAGDGLAREEGGRGRGGRGPQQRGSAAAGVVGGDDHGASGGAWGRRGGEPGVVRGALAGELRRLGCLGCLGCLGWELRVLAGLDGAGRGDPEEAEESEEGRRGEAGAQADHASS
ncbi:hypothetical protein [Nannocystis sp.]|uniref:hypothetical protein n=1 Tax=Nannocystis sp. TaxID=1962667 RepID=UPI0025CDF3D1|nr:hypothetical protein [Nannocystis sp.]MBK7829428.1 hypothetical protein [Nannocystis sp.]